MATTCGEPCAIVGIVPFEDVQEDPSEELLEESGAEGGEEEE